MSVDIAVSLGTSRTRIYVQNEGVVLNESSIVAVDLDNDSIFSVGCQAEKMIGKTSKIDVISPLDRGVISDFNLVEGMFNCFLKKIKISQIIMPRAVVCVPGEITDVEKRAVVNVISAVGVRKVCLIEKSLAAAMGAGLDCLSPVGNLILNIGGGTTDMAVISLNGIVAEKSIKVAGSSIDESIVKNIKKKYNLLIGKRMAEAAKIEIGCLVKRKPEKVFRIKGRNLVTGLPYWIDISSNEMLEMLIDPIMEIISYLKNLLIEVPPEIAGDIYQNGIMLTGGTANLYGLDKLISKKTGLKVIVPDEPENCAIIGAGKAIKYINQLEKEGYKPANPLIAEY